ncbi:MAG: DNA polymerase III subunit gamma/tau [Acidobacteriota bacterium]|nr:DNA polymerase III subunit gamma/tau [Acidobacteriota bacterium]
MGYQVLARKYRPQKFADVAGQDHVTRTLLNALEQQRTAHGYIFSGHRGIGKTTIARILAMALNCRTEIGSAERPTPEPCGTCDSCTEVRAGNAVDVIEIDAATNRGIDEIRELRDAARYAPARDRYKIYILDEAHQITDAAFNALLKSLEEPPPHVIFMMATTEPENIPQTIRSRCQHFSFHAVKFDDILAQLKMISAQESVNAEEAALALLAEAGDGSMRDALSIMDQAIASAPVESGKANLGADLIRDLMGSVPNAVFERLLEAVAQGQSAALMEQLNVLLNAGNSPSSLARQMVRYLRNALMAKLGGEQTELLQISADERARATRTAMLFSEEDLTRALQIVLRTFDDLNYRQEQRFHLELGLLKLIHAQRLLPLEELLSGVAGGASVKAVGGQMTRAVGSPSGSSMMTGSSSLGSSVSKPIGFSTGWTPAVTLAPAMTPPPSATASTAAMPMPVAAPPPPPPPPSDPIPVLTPFEKPVKSASVEPEPVTENSNPAGAQDTNAMREAVVTALNDGGHSSAAQLLHSGTWTVDGSNLRIEVAGMGKKMLALTVNAQAEKIIRQVLQKMNAPARFLVIPGEGTGNTSSALPSSAPAGSVQQLAMENPLVKRAQEIFNAEVRSVLDLRSK